MTVQFTDINGDGIPDQLFFNGEIQPGAGYPYFFFGTPSFDTTDLLTAEVLVELIGEEAVEALFGGTDEDGDIEQGVESLIAGLDNGEIYMGTTGADMIVGGAGNDLLIGDAGADATSPAVDDIAPL